VRASPLSLIAVLSVATVGVATTGCREKGLTDTGRPALGPPVDVVVGDFTVTLRPKTGTFDVAGPFGEPVTGVRLLAGTGDGTAVMQVGSFQFSDISEDVQAPTTLAVDGASATLYDADRMALGEAQFAENAVSGTLRIRWSAADPAANRLGLGADCTDDDHFLGLGLHAMDVDHVGQSFPLWVSEPGIGKVETEVPSADWYVKGTRHATSLPMPWLLRPHQNHGLLLDALSRVDMDLCDTDPATFRAVAWDRDSLDIHFVTGESGMDVVSARTRLTGTPPLPPRWAFGPWNDALKGPAEVSRVATALREAGASTGAIWTEDWRGSFESALTGYHPGHDWDLDPELYPDADAFAAELRSNGFAWLSYFAPFVSEDTDAWDDAVEQDVLIKDEAGEIYTFQGALFQRASTVDLSTEAGRAWATAQMDASLDHGFAGFMADFAEWLPVDAVLADGSTGWEAHQRYPEWWQEAALDAVGDRDAVSFSRSGWTNTPGLAQVTWAGDQRTSFDTDDGLPTVVAMGLGAGASGIGVFTHDIAGYQSIGNDPSDKELWLRWAALGAYTPIMRTHHGAFGEGNWAFDEDEETLAAWVSLTREHMRLLPYRYGLAANAASTGEPSVFPPVLLFPDDDPARMDGWMLGSALFIAPVIERGADTVDVTLPPGPTWTRWHTGEPASSGAVSVPWGEIAVFAASGTTVPTWAEAPDTSLPDAGADLTGPADVDGARVVYLFGGGGPFTEADGTEYLPEGEPTGPGSVTQTLRTGTVGVAGVAVTVDGPIERTYTFIVP
jgi:sulfoquinovosidase